jgi:hypothetical protein
MLVQLGEVPLELQARRDSINALDAAGPMEQFMEGLSSWKRVENPMQGLFFLVMSIQTLLATGESGVYDPRTGRDDYREPLMMRLGGAAPALALLAFGLSRIRL